MAGAFVKASSCPTRTIGHPRCCPSFLGGAKRNVYNYNELTPVRRFWLKVTTDGLFENYIAKSIVGFLSGIFLTYMFFMFFVFQLDFSFSTATCICALFGLILTLGLAFSDRVRCIVLMMLPQFFSKRGRQALIAYAFILAFTGPARNVLHNTGVLSESLACGQEQLKSAVRNVMDIVKKPFATLKAAISKVLENIKAIVERVKDMLITLKRLVMGLVNVIKNAYDWLNSIVSMCSRKVGTPFQRCMGVLDDAIIDCQMKLGPMFDWMCSVTYVAQTLCYSVKFIDYICELYEFVSDEIVNKVKKSLRVFSHHMHNMFYVNIKFSHSFGFETKASKTAKEIAAGILTEIRQRTDAAFHFFDWMSFAFSFFFLFMIVQVVRYRHKFLTSDKFDNVYITKLIFELDYRRTLQNKETILPLNRREANKYVKLTSFRLVEAEKKKFYQSMTFLLLTSFKLSIHMIADYSLYWVLKTIRYHGRFQSNLEAPGSIGVQVQGSGIIADMYTSVVQAFSPSSMSMAVDSIPCLPDPVPPDTYRYMQIVSLIIITFVLTLLEPWGLRMRHSVLNHYHPDVAKTRAVSLYNHILASRNSFLKLAQRTLHRRFSLQPQADTTFIDKLKTKIPCIAWFTEKKERCILCGFTGTSNEPLIKCATPGCIGIYCSNCYADINLLCSICKAPVQYEDMMGISEEKDSSDEEPRRVASRSLPGGYYKLGDVDDLSANRGLATGHNDEKTFASLTFPPSFDSSTHTFTSTSHRSRPRDRASIRDLDDIKLVHMLGNRLGQSMISEHHVQLQSEEDDKQNNKSNSEVVAGCFGQQDQVPNIQSHSKLHEITTLRKIVAGSSRDKYNYAKKVSIKKDLEETEIRRGKVLHDRSNAGTLLDNNTEGYTLEHSVINGSKTNQSFHVNNVGKRADEEFHSIEGHKPKTNVVNKTNVPVIDESRKHNLPVPTHANVEIISNRTNLLQNLTLKLKHRGSKGMSSSSTMIGYSHERYPTATVVPEKTSSFVVKNTAGSERCSTSDSRCDIDWNIRGDNEVAVLHRDTNENPYVTEQKRKEIKTKVRKCAESYPLHSRGYSESRDGVNELLKNDIIKEPLVHENIVNNSAKWVAGLKTKPQVSGEHCSKNKPLHQKERDDLIYYKEVSVPKCSTYHHNTICNQRKSTQLKQNLPLKALALQIRDLKLDSKQIIGQDSAIAPNNVVEKKMDTILIDASLPVKSNLSSWESMSLDRHGGIRSVLGKVLKLFKIRKKTKFVYEKINRDIENNLCDSSESEYSQTDTYEGEKSTDSYQGGRRTITRLSVANSGNKQYPQSSSSSSSSSSSTQDTSQYYKIDDTCEDSKCGSEVSSLYDRKTKRQRRRWWHWPGAKYRDTSEEETSSCVTDSSDDDTGVV